MADSDLRSKPSHMSREIQTMSTTAPSQPPAEDGGSSPTQSNITALPETPRKRLRFDDGGSPTPRTPQSRQRPAITVQSPTGPKVIHINTEEYEARLNDVVTEPWVSPETIAYLYKFFNYYNNQGPRFPIHRVPSTLQWSVVDENPRYMHATFKNRPMLIWVVATLVDASLAVTRNYPAPRVRFVLEFVRERDRKEAIALYNKAAGTTLSRMDTLIVTGATSDNEGPQTCEEIYDARESFQEKKKMKHVTQAKLHSGDIVLVECTLVTVESDKTGAKSVSWIMNALYWLAERPRAAKSLVLYEETPFSEVFRL